MEDSMHWIVAAVQHAKLHKEMCRRLARVLNATVQIFPALEAVRPGCRSGIQALSALRLALERAKSLLHYCGNSSKLYLAMTGDSIVLKFERVKSGLDQNLRELAAIVSESLAKQIAPVLVEITQAKFLLDPSEKQLGAEILSLLLAEKTSDLAENDVFERLAAQLGLLSPKLLLEEQKALKNLLQKSQSAGDRKKESILIYFLHLLKNYSKCIKSNSSSSLSVERNVSSTESPCGKKISRNGTIAMDLKNSDSDSLRLDWRSPNCLKKGSKSLPLVPEEFRCPICLQLMSDPVIIASGQTYERVCIEEWFQEGHDTCPKTQQKLPNMSVTPNSCVKNLIVVWCQENGISLPDPSLPPDSSKVSWSSASFSSLDMCKEIDVDKLKDGVMSFRLDGILHMEKEGEHVETSQSNGYGMETEDAGSLCFQKGTDMRKRDQGWCLDTFEQLLADLSVEDLDIQCRAANDIESLTRGNSRLLSQLGDRYIPILVNFLCTAVRSGCNEAQETGLLILTNFSVYSRRNKASIVTTGGLPHLLDCLQLKCESTIKRAAFSLLMNLSSLEESKVEIGASGAIEVLVELMNSYIHGLEILVSLCNLSTVANNARRIIHANSVPKLVHLLKFGSNDLFERCLLLLYHISSLEEGRYAILGSEGCITAVVEFLEVGTNEEQEHAAAILLVLCTHSFTISQLILKEGVIPSLVALSVHGNTAGREKALALLQLFREQRQRKGSRLCNLADSHLQEPSAGLEDECKDEVIVSAFNGRSFTGSSSLMS